MAVFIDPSIYLSAWASSPTLHSATAALLLFNGRDPAADLDRIQSIRRHPSTCHVALFGYSETPVTNDLRIQAADSGLINLFVYPEFDDYILAQLNQSVSAPRGVPFPSFSANRIYKLFTYDDSSAVLGRVNQLARRANITPAGRTGYDQFEKDAPAYDADLYLVDLIHSETCIGIDLITDLSKTVKGAIVAHSRIADPKVKVACINAGACGFIEKSANDDALLSRLKTYAAIGHFKRSQA